MSVKSLCTAVVALLIALVPGGVAAQGIATYRPVTDQRLGNPSTPNWLPYRGTYDGWGFHPADLINTTNVKQLVPVWSFSTGEIGGHQAPPIVNASVMFISTPRNQVIALDATTGALLWRYKRELPEDLRPRHSTNRGIGLYEEKVYLATLDAHLVALDAKTGQVVWEKAVDNYKMGAYMTLAPLVAKGKVMVGMAGGEYGLRGYIAAFDARTGDEVWKTYTIPGPGEPGHDTWSLVFMGGTNDRYFRAFDAKTGEVLWEFRTNSAITGVPISYGRIGVQYIAVQSGWGAEARQMQAELDTALGTKTDVPPGGVVWVFGLRE